MAPYLRIFFVAFTGTFMTYIVFFYNKVNKDGETKIFIKSNVVLSISIALVLTILLKLMSLELELSTVLAFFALGLIENSIFLPVIFKEGSIDIGKKEGILAAVISKVLVFVVLYLIVFL